MIKLIYVVVLICVLAVPAVGQSASAQRVLSWQGEYVGFQRIADTRRPFVNGGYALTFLSIVGIGKKNSVQFQLIIPVFAGRQAPIYRVAIDRRLF